MKTLSEKLRFGEKVSYGLGDLASNFVWGMTSSYLLFFYTNVFGLAAGVVGTLMLITRIADAIIDPFIGVMIDRTNTKYGKARPYLLYMALPFAIMSVLTFVTPNFSDTGKLIYAYVTYMILGILYSAINLPYGALMSLMTRDSKEKTQLGSFRMMGMALGAIIVAAFTESLVAKLGGGNPQIGYPLTMALYSVIAFVLFLLVFKYCKERYTGQAAHAQAEGKKEDIRKSLKSMFKNKPWILIALNSLVIFLRLGLMYGVLIYYVTYVLDQADMIPLYLTLANVANFAGGLVAPYVLGRLGKRNGSIAVLSGSLILFIVLMFLENSSSALFITLFFIANTLIGINFPANFAMLADTADYHEWKFGQRTEGTLYSAYSFATKFGSAVGAAAVAYALGWAGYNPDALTDQAVSMIRILMYVGPILLTAAQILILIFYKLDQQHAGIVKELDERSGLA